VVTRLNQHAQILWNRTVNSGNWIALELTGSKSNRDAIGAWVEVETADSKQWDRVAGWSGYGCSSSRTMHFGMGSALVAKSVAVHWPSGKVTRLEDVTGNRTLQIREPD